MQVTLESLPRQAEQAAATLKTRAEFEAFKAQWVGPNSPLTQAIKNIAHLDKDKRPAAGRQINAVKQALDQIFQQILARVEATENSIRLGPPLDPSLPSPEPPKGRLHPIEQVRREIVALFSKVGFSVAEGPEVETEYFVFDALNTPPSHPARDPRDTYYLAGGNAFVGIERRGNERCLLRTHTSSVQIHTLLREPPPLRILSPGRCFRRDTTDATHSANFHQIEGLCVDKGLTVKDLKALLDYFVKELLGGSASTRFRPHYFPYTEPSFEVDFSAEHLPSIRKQWVEVMGCGMVDPAVFEAVGYDPEKNSGFAFGLGLERIAMILYGVDDIRYLYQNDLRFLKQFGH